MDTLAKILKASKKAQTKKAFKNILQNFIDFQKVQEEKSGKRKIFKML